MFGQHSSYFEPNKRNPLNKRVTFSRILKKRTVLKKTGAHGAHGASLRILGEPNALQARTLKKRATTKKRSHRVNKRHANP